MNTVWVLGSGECDQLGTSVIKLGLGPDVRDVLLPEKIPSFPAGIKVFKLACGGLHTLALTSEGKVFSWGCNDDKALGRSGTESLPAPVEDLKVAVSDIAAGDSHSIAYNKELSVIYLWGLYRNTRHGNFMDPIKKPQVIGEFEFRRKTIQKVVCGAHYTLFLVDGHVSAVGDPENDNLGRMVLDRHRRDKDMGLRIERVDSNKKKCVDIFTGSYHSFAIKEDGKLYAWGLNNYGQLGTGDYKNARTMKEVQGLDGSQIAMIAGGESHSVALMKNGEVYSWGRNDENQLGYKLPEKTRVIPNSNESAKEEEKINPEIITENGNKAEVMKIDNNIAKTPEELMTQLGAKEDEPKDCSPIPKKIESLSNIVKISAGTNFTYALSKELSIYSW